MKKKIFAICLVLALIINLPVVVSKAAYHPEDLTFLSKNILLVNLDTDYIVYENDADQKVSPASLTKIMTAIVVLENITDLDATEITAKKEIVDSFLGTGSSIAGIKADEVLTARQLLYCTMVRSGNDAASILADYIGGGSIDNFITMMNKRAKELGAENTNFVNPHGLTDPDHYTTARDLYKIFKHALTLNHFNDLISTTRYTLPETNKNPARTFATTNLMLDRNIGSRYYYSPLKGGKTGRTSDAGNCFISIAEKDGYNYLCVVLGAPTKDENGNNLPVTTNEAFGDTKKLYEWAFDTFAIKTIVTEDESVGQCHVNLSASEDRLLLYPNKTFAALIPKQVEASSANFVMEIPEFIDAPVLKGQVIGRAKIMLSGQELGEINLISGADIERSSVKYFIQRVKTIANSLIFKIVTILLILLIIAYIIYCIIYNKKHRKYKRVRRRRL